MKKIFKFETKVYKQDDRMGKFGRVVVTSKGLRDYVGQKANVIVVLEYIEEEKA